MTKVEVFSLEVIDASAGAFVLLKLQDSLAIVDVRSLNELQSFYNENQNTFQTLSADEIFDEYSELTGETIGCVLADEVRTSKTEVVKYDGSGLLLLRSLKDPECMYLIGDGPYHGDFEYLLQSSQLNVFDTTKIEFFVDEILPFSENFEKLLINFEGISADQFQYAWLCAVAEGDLRLNLHPTTLHELFSTLLEDDKAQRQSMPAGSATETGFALDQAQLTRSKKNLQRCFPDLKQTLDAMPKETMSNSQPLLDLSAIDLSVTDLTSALQSRYCQQRPSLKI